MIIHRILIKEKINNDSNSNMYESMDDILKNSNDYNDYNESNQHECLRKSTCKDIACITLISVTGCGIYLLYFVHLLNETINNNSTNY